jgi:hypothetical protein
MSLFMPDQFIFLSGSITTFHNANIVLDSQPFVKTFRCRRVRPKFLESAGGTLPTPPGPPKMSDTFVFALLLAIYACWTTIGPKFANEKRL